LADGQKFVAVTVIVKERYQQMDIVNVWRSLIMEQNIAMAFQEINGINIQKK